MSKEQTTIDNVRKAIVTLDADEYNTVKRWMVDNDDGVSTILPHGMHKIVLEEDTSRALIYMSTDCDQSEMLTWVNDLMTENDATAVNRVMH